MIHETSSRSLIARRNSSDIDDLVAKISSSNLSNIDHKVRARKRRLPYDRKSTLYADSGPNID
jgi:hypothetical protein